MKLLRIKIGKKSFTVKDSRGLGSVRGLMFDNMDGHDGALITASGIWMPFVKKKLNLVFLDKEMKTVGQQMAVPLSWHPKTWRVYSSDKAKYCLELKHTKLKVKQDTKVEISI